MNYWLLCLPRPDMEHCMKVGTFGMTRKYMLGNVLEGDKVVCCATKDWKILGIGVATSDYYVDDKRIFLADGIFPDRFDFSATVLEVQHQLDLRTIMDKLTFVSNPSNWAVFFRTGFVKLHERDWNLISERTEEQSKTG